jgi:hypothetical protein
MSEDQPGGGRMAMLSADRSRALIIPVFGILSVVALFWIAVSSHADDKLLGIAITAVTTLTAAAAGHAAGSSKRP